MMLRERASANLIPTAAVLLLLLFCVWFESPRVIATSGVSSPTVFLGGAQIACNSSTRIAITTATTTQIVAAVANQVISICAFLEESDGTINVTWVYGTGAACAVGQVALTGPMHLSAGESHFPGTGIGILLQVPAGNALCLVTTGAGNLAGYVNYVQR